MNPGGDGDATALQDLMRLQQRRARWGTAGWVVLCALLALLVFQQFGRDEPSVEISASSADAGRVARLEEQLLEMRARMVELEVAQRAAFSAGLWQAEPLAGDGPSPGPFVGSSDGANDSPRVVEAGPRVDSSIGLSGKPEPSDGGSPVAVTDPAFAARMEDLLARADDREWAVESASDNESGAGAGSSNEGEVAAGSSDVSEGADDAAVEPGGGGEIDGPEVAAPSRPDPDEVVSELNRLLEDSGLVAYQCLEAAAAELDGEGLVDVTLVERDDSGLNLGSLFVGKMGLEYFEPRRAQFLLDDCHGMRAGVRLEFPHRQKKIEVPGMLSRAVIGDLLLPLFGMTSTQIAISAGDGVAAAEQLNEVLTDVEHLDLHVRSVGSIQAEELIDVVIDLHMGPDGEPDRTVHAERAWWVLDEKSAYVELHCEGGELVVNGRRRPLFRNHFTHPLRNIHAKVWAKLPAVRVVTPDDDDSPGE